MKNKEKNKKIKESVIIGSGVMRWLLEPNQTKQHRYVLHSSSSCLDKGFYFCFLLFAFYFSLLTKNEIGLYGAEDTAACLARDTAFIPLFL